GQDGAPRERDLEPFSRLDGRALVPGRIALLADGQRDTLGGQRRVLVNELALGVRLAELLVVEPDGGVGDGRPSLADGHGEVAGGAEIGLDRVAVNDFAVLAELDQERRLPRGDAVS